MLYIEGKQLVVGEFPNHETFFDTDEILRVPNFYIDESGKRKSEVKVSMKFESNEDVIQLRFLKDYLDGIGIDANLYIPYLPYSRMDRTEGIRPFTLKTICKMLNEMNFKTITVEEAHSDVCVALLDRVVVIDKSIKIANEVLKKCPENTVLVYPDAGAAKRYSKSFTRPYLTCNKVRDFKTGQITSLDVLGSVPASNFTAVIIDDLCSKGGTFIFTAKKLKEMGAKDIILVTTHCEDTMWTGEIPYGDLITEMYTTDSIIHDKEVKKIHIEKCDW